MDISDWRREIDAIDDELLELLCRRTRCAAEIGRHKRRRGLPIMDSQREQMILDKVEAKSRAPLLPGALRNIFTVIMAETRRAEEALEGK